MKKKYYELTVIFDGGIPVFTIEDSQLKSFEEWFEKGGQIKFIDQDDKGEVTLKSGRTSGVVGYKKTPKEIPQPANEDKR